MAVVDDAAWCDIRNRLLAFGAPPGTIRRVLERAILAKGTGEDKDGPDDEPVRRLNVWRGMTGQVLTEVDCKPQTTARQVKHDIYLKTGIPIAQQQLFGFGSSNLIGDEQLVDTVPELEGCGGLQIIVDAPGEGPAVVLGGMNSGCWVDCDEEETEEPYEKKVSSSDDSPGSDEEGRSRSNKERQHCPRSGRQQQHGRGRAKGHGKGGGQWEAETAWRCPAAASPAWAAAAGGEGAGQGKGRGAGTTGVAKRWGEASSAYGGSSKMQCHFIIHRRLRELDFDVLARAKPRTKNIWLATGVSLRLHGPGSGQQEDEEELMLSVSAKRCDCNPAAFAEAVQQAEELIRSLNEQYRRYCLKVGRREPESLGLRSERGYRRGSHKIRWSE